MIFLYLYCTIGLIFFLLACGGSFSEGNGPPTYVGSFWDSLKPSPMRVRERLRGISFFLFACVVVVAFWPVCCLIQLHDRYNAAKGDRDKPPPFAPVSGDLLELLDISTIEQREMVTDPFGAVPAVPFGHLNRIWVDFRDTVADDARIWSFSAVWTNQSGYRDRKEGYVVVGPDGSIGYHAVTRFCRLDD